MRSHTEITEVWRKAKQDEFNRYSIVVAVNNGRFRISIGLPTTCLKIDPECMRWDLTKNLISRKFASDKNHD